MGYKKEYNPMFESGCIIKKINDSIDIRKEVTFS
jgi:hypothetical protein